MKGKWKVLTNRFGGEPVYQVARVIDTADIMHAGNLEYARGIYFSREFAQSEAHRLNAAEAQAEETHGLNE